MNVDNYNDGLFFSVWTWMTMLALFAVVSLGVAYGFSTHRPVKLGVGDVGPMSMADSRLKLEASPYAHQPPKSAFGPWKGDEAKSNPKPQPKPQKVQTAERKAMEQQVKDMFPTRRLTEPAPKPDPAPRPREIYPSFTCAGKQWQSTGRFATSGQLDLVPSSCSIGGRSLYALAGSGNDPKALFVRSLRNPNRFAIYR